MWWYLYLTFWIPFPDSYVYPTSFLPNNRHTRKCRKKIQSSFWATVSLLSESVLQLNELKLCEIFIDILRTVNKTWNELADNAPEANHWHVHDACHKRTSYLPEWKESWFVLANKKFENLIRILAEASDLPTGDVIANAKCVCSIMYFELSEMREQVLRWRIVENGMLFVWIVEMVGFYCHKIQKEIEDRKPNKTRWIIWK